MFSFMITSADGYHADPGQALDWQTIDEEFSQFAQTQLRDAGTLVFGRVPNPLPPPPSSPAPRLHAPYRTSRTDSVCAFPLRSA